MSGMVTTRGNHFWLPLKRYVHSSIRTLTLFLVVDTSVFNLQRCLAFRARGNFQTGYHYQTICIITRQHPIPSRLHITTARFSVFLPDNIPSHQLSDNIPSHQPITHMKTHWTGSSEGWALSTVTNFQLAILVW